MATALDFDTLRELAANETQNDFVHTVLSADLIADPDEVAIWYRIFTTFTPDQVEKMRTWIEDEVAAAQAEYHNNLFADDYAANWTAAEKAEEADGHRCLPDCPC